MPYVVTESMEFSMRSSSFAGTTEMEKARKRLLATITKYECLGPINYDELDIMKIMCRKKIRSDKVFVKSLCFFIFFSAYIAIYHSNLSTEKSCLLDAPTSFSEIFRRPVDCGFCQTVTKIDKIHNVTVQDFYSTYVKNSRPVIVKDATQSWKAMKLFSFDFFKNLYVSTEEEQELTCQFFPYKTEFKSLSEALNMSYDRAHLKSGEEPWYIGWSNCFKKGGNILQNYYSRPYFLPYSSENIALHWIFMGSPGKGAPLHVDNVLYPSWQAQIKGLKQWYLTPPLECSFECHSFSVTVEPGELIMLDTNVWYHKTTILPGEISITIGTEFD
ncbi:hypothetical protein HHI36_001616 [Cryptolaemus montrouzieri]|uniref:Cupin-like domain-containing protein n=1 Tax=Cryptolaemus montrouzieri TaxID=559131 RepID=A0ABD2P8X7_9CUCU